MSIINQYETTSINSSLDLFELPKIQTAVESGHFTVCIKKKKLISA